MVCERYPATNSESCDVGGNMSLLIRLYSDIN